MSEPLSSSDANDADLCGLPQRSDSRGRDPLEELASRYLDRLRAGETVDVAQFAREHRAHERELIEFLPLVAAMEDWKSNQELRSVRHPLPEHFTLERLGDCRIVREIARGGMGVVFEAEQEPIGRRVAVKLLPWRFPAESRWREQFLQEARVAARLQHPNIVPVFSFGEHEGRYFYVMQLIEGVGLDKLIQHWKTNPGPVVLDDLIAEHHPEYASRWGHPQERQRFRRALRHDAWQQMGKIAAQIAGALKYAHQQGTLHRDIKPANLLIDRHGKVWIADFGLAVGRDRAISSENEPLMGTLRYMAPEQFSGSVDERSDLYAFGVTLFELCTLQAPFGARSKQALIQEIQHARLPSPRSLNGAIPSDLSKTIVKALNRDPAGRHQSADELHAELLKFVQRMSHSPGTALWRKLRRWF